MKVVIDARFESGQAGGVESVVIGLVSALSSLADGDEEYLVLAHSDEVGWLDGHVHGAARLLILPSRSSVKRMRRRASAVAPTIARGWRTVRGRVWQGGNVPPSDGTIERAGADVMHFTHQSGFTTAIPSIYHPHDLQHLHLPEYFTREVIASRERTYRALCEQAAMVAVASSWTKGDIERAYGLSPEKVLVVPWAPPTAAYEVPEPPVAAEIRHRLGIPDAYILYPAQTWPHKNHVGLLRALALLRDRHGVIVPLVASGRRNDGFGQIERQQTALGLTTQVTWVDFVSSLELQALYAGARAVVVPSRFEAASFPVWEAFASGVAAACSNVTSLPEQAGDAALVFDPLDIDQMADAIRRLWTDGDLRATLIEKGSARVRRFTWDRTARLFRAHYRRLAHVEVTDDDRELLAADPMI
jgi:glycosyltransferase involved in cell wall biosynthesis